MLGCYQNSNERKERNGGALYNTYRNYVKCACIEVCVCVVICMYLCRCASLKIYARRHFVCSSVCTYIFTHVRRPHEKSGARNEMKILLFAGERAEHPRTTDRLPVRPRSHHAPHCTIVGNPICYPPTLSAVRTREPRSLCATCALPLSLALKWDEFYLCTHSLCECVFIVLVSLFVYTGAQMAQLHT